MTRKTISEVDAKQGVMTGRVRYVLMFGLVLAALAAVLVFSVY